mgnify:CR=1 FL=1
MSGVVGVAPGTTTVRLPTGQIVALTDWRDDKYFGAVEFAVGDNSPLSAYSTGLSQVIPGGARPQTDVDTNVPRNGDSGLPQSFEALVYGWGIKMSRAHRGTVNDLLDFSDPVAFRTFFEIDRRMAFKFRYNRKDYTEGVIQDYPQGHGIHLTTTQPTTEIAQNGIPSPRDRVALVLPVHLRENLGFAGIFTPIVALSFLAVAGGGQPASDGGVALTLLDLKLYSFGLLRINVV